MQCLVGITAGWWMGRSGRYKWLVVLGACIRLIGYGIMIRLRTQDSTIGELFAQQLIQGTGSGIISTALLVVPTTVVPRAQIPQLLALALCCVFLGSSIGSTVAGGIYTNTMRESLWKWLGLKTSPVLIESLYNSITGELPVWGTPERIAINYAVSSHPRPLFPIGFCTTKMIANEFIVLGCRHLHYLRSNRGCSPWNYSRIVVA